jgi:hypothetical protein
MDYSEKLILKTIVVLLLSFVFFSGTAQPGEDPVLYLNKKEVSFESIRYLNPANIDSVHVDKSTKNGSIHVFTKEKVKFLTPEEIVKRYTNLNEPVGSLLFQINNDIVYDISGIKIDASYFIYVEVKNVSEVKYIDEKFRGMKIVVIGLEKEERKPDIRIRGVDKIIGNFD